MVKCDNQFASRSEDNQSRYPRPRQSDVEIRLHEPVQAWEEYKRGRRVSQARIFRNFSLLAMLDCFIDRCGDADSQAQAAEGLGGFDRQRAASLSGSSPGTAIYRLFSPAMDRVAMTRSNSSKKGRCSSRIKQRASARLNQSPRSISGITTLRPERGGQSISQVLLTRAEGTQSPSNAHPLTTLPLLWRTDPRLWNGGEDVNPVSS